MIKPDFSIPIPNNADSFPILMHEAKHTDTKAVYEGSLSIPQTMRGRQLLIRADRVGAETELFANGIPIGRHHGSFTQWNIFLPAFASTQLVLRAVLKMPKQRMNPYEKQMILGGFTLFVLPLAYVTSLSAAITKRNTEYVLEIGFQAEGAYTHAIAEVFTKAGDIAAAGDTTGCQLRLSCPDVQTWTPEHPVQYHGRLSLFSDDTLTSVIEFPIGFWQAQRANRQVLVDGEAIRLRGLNYREPFIFEGRNVENELRLFKAAHVNFLRALYYPFSQRTLSLCSKLGIYVEQTLPFWGVGIDGEPAQNLPHLESTFVFLCKETLAEGMHEPCVLLWSLGGECCWGSNFRACYHTVKALDTRRLTDFHFPMTIPQDGALPDVFSVADVDYRLPSDVCYDHMVIGHTQGSDNAIGYATAQAEYSLPVLHVSYAHVPCYNRDELQADPGLHEFWGESLWRCAQNLFASDACMGGAVMAAVDENGLFDSRLRGMERGVLDAQGTPKPEYYHLQMVYGGSPIRTKATPRLKMPALPPQPIQVEETDDQILLHNGCFHAVVSKVDCLLDGIWVGSRRVLAKGPYLQSTRYLLDPWKGETAAYRQLPGGSVALTLTGGYGDAATIRFALTFTPNGRLDCTCKALRLGRDMPHTVKAGIGLDPGGLNELGVSFLLPAVDTFRWHRNGLWNRYPDHHIGRNVGETPCNESADARAMKHHITGASLLFADGYGIGVLSGGKHSVRLEEQPQDACIVDDRSPLIEYTGIWYSVDDNCGYYRNTLSMSREPGAAMTLRFSGTGITLYGSLHILHGLYSVELDHQLVADSVSACPLPVDFASFSRGYEKRFHQPLYCVRNLPEGEHTVTLRVLGKKEPAAQNCYVPFDYAVIETPDQPPLTRLIVNNDFNYTRLVRGNFMRPRICLEIGKPYTCALQLLGKADEL